MPSISVVIPTFRRPRYLAQALASILAQRLPDDVDLEVLVCDNAGSQETADLVTSTGDARIVHVRRPHDLGMMRNAVDGFTQARGDYVLKFDDDDLLHPDALAELVAPFRRQPDLALTFASFDLVDEHGQLLAERTSANEIHSGRAQLTAGRYEPFDRLVVSGAVGMVCALVRRDTVDFADMPEDVATAYDRHIALQSARHGAAAWYVDRTLASYRLHARSDSVLALTRQSLGSLRATERALEARDHADRRVLLDEAQEAALRAARLLLREDPGPGPAGGDIRAQDRHVGHADETARRILTRALRRRRDPALLQLGALALLPRQIARPIARRRLERHERHVRLVAGTSGVTSPAQGPGPMPQPRVE